MGGHAIGRQGGMMRNCTRSTTVATCLLLLGMAMIFSGCSQEKKEATLEITETEFVLRQDTNHSFVVDAKGKIRNSGDVDVKNVVVTGYCKSCGEVLINGKWFVSDYDKTPEQKDIISYLVAGAEEDFNFKGVAFYMDQSGTKPPGMPEDMQIVIDSYEIVE